MERYPQWVEVTSKAKLEGSWVPQAKTTNMESLERGMMTKMPLNS